MAVALRPPIARTRARCCRRSMTAALPLPITRKRGLTLSHYDARAHLVVARRIFDSLMPGWQQIGGVWLPLPHVLNALPVQVDALYRNGASAIAFSVLSMAHRRMGARAADRG